MNPKTDRLGPRLGALFANLRRRNVFKVAAAYAVVGWLLIQAATSMLPNLGLPSWTVTLVIVLVVVGFPVAIVLGWAYELQPRDRRADSLETGATAGDERTLATAAGDEDRPSIAVLPFLNMIGDPAQEYFADGMTEDLITDLSKISGLCVVARNSSFTFKGQAVDVREAGRTLGAHYVVEGSVRKAGMRVRINAQLIDARSGTHIWAERYDGELTEVFELQDGILKRIVSALSVSLNVAEKQRVESRLTSDLAAYDLFLRGRNELYRMTPPSLSAAIDLLEQAVTLDPGFASAHAYLSEARIGCALLSPDAGDFERGLREGLEAAQAAVACDESLGLAHAFLGWSQVWLRRYDESMVSFEKALALAPNDAEVLGHYASALNYTGEPERALELLDLAARLDPLLPPSLRFTRGASLFLLERYEEALEVFRAVIHLAPAFMGARYLAIVLLVELGRTGEAQTLADEGRKLSHPMSTEAIARVPFRDKGWLGRILAGLQAVGLPESKPRPR
jgi:adenylate cyclase